MKERRIIIGNNANRKKSNLKPIKKFFSKIANKNRKQTKE
jgi:hypothetical protein